MSRRDKLIEFANTHAFASKNAFGNAMLLSSALDHGELIPVQGFQEGEIGVKVLYIETKGRGSGQSISSVRLCFADFNEVGMYYITAWIYDLNDKQNGKVIRLKRDTIKISVIV